MLLETPTETIGIPNVYSMKMAKAEYLGAWRANGIVTKVRKSKS